MKKLFIIPIIYLFIIGCDSESPLENQAELIVIRGYLYANESVTDIQITSTLPLGTEETSAPPINDAVVYLIKEGIRYDLTPSQGDSGYYHYAGNDLAVETDDVFEIVVDFNDNTATGSTQVPEPPANVRSSGNTLYIPEFETWEDMFEFEFDSNRHQITVDWEEDEDALFFVVMENLDANPDSIESMGGFGGGMKGRFFISEPSNENSYSVNFRSVSYYGRYSIKVYRVNQEYADLYTSRQQDSRDLNEPLTNINNGLGIFSAFNSREVFINVIRD